MNLFSIIWQFIVLWCGIYIFVFIVKFYTKPTIIRRKSHGTQANILPTYAEDSEIEEVSSVNETQDIAESNNTNHGSTDEWFIHLFQVRYTTQRMNNLFSKWARLFPNFWSIWFSLGVIVGALTMIVGILVMLVAAIKILFLMGTTLFSAFQTSSSPNSNNQLQPYFKRDTMMESQEEITEMDDVNNNNNQLFLPMIPGVTLPMSHIGYYLLSLLICGVFHEAGHAIASFTEKVPIQSCGIFIYYIYPGAFVNISDQYLQLLSPFRQLKVICAGVWHNLILYLFTLILLGGGLKTGLELCGWQSLEDNGGGVSVVQVRDASPMAAHLPISSVIYQLDDMELEHNMMDWNQFLLNPLGRHDHQPHPGFCAFPESSHPLDCCDIDDEFPFGKSLNHSLSCFQHYPEGNENENEKNVDSLSCLSTIQVLGARHPERCESDSECSNEGMKCVTPYSPSIRGQIVRVYARMPYWKITSDDDQDKVFVFAGEIIDIWESGKYK
ncbi:unnamed protein product [Cunninghamella blakesleeana]